MNEHLARAGEGLRLRCNEIKDEIGSHLEHLRREVISRLPGQQRTKLESNLHAFVGGHPSSLPTPSRSNHRTPSPPAGGAVSKEEIGRATWTFLHTLAAQYPERPTRQQQRDAKALIDIMTRMYPCGECARHFKVVVGDHPPKVASRQEFSLWMCQVHNVVNRSLDKPTFNCDLAASRWAGVECDEEDACTLDWGKGQAAGRWGRLK